MLVNLAPVSVKLELKYSKPRIGVFRNEIKIVNMSAEVCLLSLRMYIVYQLSAIADSRTPFLWQFCKVIVYKLY